MKFYTGALYEAGAVAARVSTLLISKIEIGEPLYPVDEGNVARLTEAYRRGDVLPPIRVRLLTHPEQPLAEARFRRRIYGYSRILAATAAGLTAVEVEIVTCTDAEALRMEARENLDRRTLNADQRMHGIAAILQCRLDEEQSVPSGPKGPAGHRGESGLSKAARDEAISETQAKRAMHIAAIAPDAKALYRAELPDIARIDLEVIAAAPSERQVEVTQQIIDDRKAGRPRTTAAPKAGEPPAVETTPAEDPSEARADEFKGINVGVDSGDPGDGPQLHHQGETEDIASRADPSPQGGASQRDGTTETDPRADGNESKAPPPPAGPTDKGNDADDRRQADPSKAERDFDRLQKSWQRADQDARQHFVAWLDGQGALEPLMKRARTGNDEASNVEMAGQTDPSRKAA